MPTVNIKLRKPFAKQQEIINTAKRNNILLLARRSGKTTIEEILVGEQAVTIPGYRVAWSTFNWKDLLLTFERFISLLEPIKKRISREEKIIELRNDSVLEFWSSQDPDAGRGRWYHRWVADEIQKQKQLEKFILGSVRPSLMDKRGELWLSGTPNGEGSEFHQYHEKVVKLIAEGNPNWIIQRGTPRDNPYISDEEIQELYDEYVAIGGANYAAQELDALWVRIDGVAPLVYKMLWDSLYCVPEEYRKSKKILALDAAKDSDSCALSAVWKDLDNDEYYTDHDDVLLFNQRTELNEYDFLALEELIWQRWITGQFYAFTYDPYQSVMLAQSLRRRGVRCIEFSQNNMRTKSDSYFKQCLSNNTYHHPDHMDLTQHVLNATLKYATSNSGIRIIKVDKTKNIDLAVATSMALWQLSQLEDAMLIDYEPAYAENAFVVRNTSSPFAVNQQFSPWG